MGNPLSYEQELIDAIPVPMFFMDVEGAFIGSNQAFNLFIGKSDTEVREMGVYQLLSGNNVFRHEEIDRILLKNGSIQPFEEEAIGAHSKRYFVRYRKALVHDVKGHVTGIVTTIVDLTDLREVEDALMASESQKKAILDGFPGVLALFDNNLSAIWVNDAGRRTGGKSIGKPCHDIICKSTHNCRDCAVTQSVQSGEVEVAVRTIDSTSGGVEQFFEVIGTPVKNAQGEVENVIVIARNITKRFELEKQLRQTQKLEAVGTLAGGIAHDFNNMLTPIMGYSEIIKLRMSQNGFDDELISEYLGEIFKAGKRAKNLVEQILTFSRSSEQKESRQYLHPIINEVLRLMRSTLPSTIEIDQDIDKTCGPVSIDAVQIQQILINLCTNSSEAIGQEHGKLTVSLKKTELQDDTEKEWLELSVSDSGCGMNQELLERVFDPYFTTKEKGRGTGLGLALVHSIITNHGGHISVATEKNIGSTFQIFLPVSKEATRFDQILTVNNESLDDEKRVILVDDDAQVVQVTSELLKSIGYQVNAFTSPVAALEKFQENPETYDLLLTDLTMPRLTGVELCNMVKVVRPELPVILFTGYSESLDNVVVSDSCIDEYCLKPLSLVELSQTVGRLIGRAQENIN